MLGGVLKKILGISDKGRVGLGESCLVGTSEEDSL